MGVSKVSNLTAAQRSLGVGQGVDLLACVPGFARTIACRQAVQRHGIAVAGLASGVDQGFIVGRQQAVGEGEEGI